jgi:hypothetical protein
MIIQTKEEVLKKLEYFNDPLFHFDEPTHTYTYEGVKMNGTTTFLERFIKKFDSDYWSKKKADDEGITQEEMLARWDAKRDRACEMGSNVHNYIEDYYERPDDIRVPKEDEEALFRIEKWHKIYESRLNKLESIGSEIRVFSKKWNLAGMLDKLYIYQGAVVIGDWKTNEKIKTDTDFCFNKLLYPFEKYKENEINKYSIQISFYMLMLEEAGIDVSYGFICHIPHEGEAQIYKLKDFRAELRTYMNHMALEQSLITEEKQTEEKTEEKSKQNRRLW